MRGNQNPLKTSKIKLFAKIINSLQQFTISAKLYILASGLGFERASVHHQRQNPNISRVQFVLRLHIRMRTVILFLNL